MELLRPNGGLKKSLNLERNLFATKNTFLTSLGQMMMMYYFTAWGYHRLSCLGGNQSRTSSPGHLPSWVSR
jgi:hypothetical protein